MNRELKEWERRQYMEWRNHNETREDSFLQSLVECVGSAFALAAVFALAWIFAAATRPQMSAECEALRSEFATAEAAK